MTAPNYPLDRGTPLLVALHGSHAYGLNHANSDEDRLGVYAAETDEWLGLDPPSSKQQSVVRHEPDVTFHEARKACVLALQCNPTILELLHMREHEYATQLGAELLQLAPEFLSRGAVADAYVGFMKSQVAKIELKLEPSNENDSGRILTLHQRRDRAEKMGRHLLRLHIQFKNLWLTSTMTVKLRPAVAQDVFEFGRSVADGDVDAARRELANARALESNELISTLPEEPNLGPIKEWLRRVRREYWPDDLIRRPSSELHN